MSDGEVESEPEMNLNRMSTHERRRLTISPNFRDRLSAVFARKTSEINEQSLKPVVEGEDKPAAKVPVVIGLNDSDHGRKKVISTGAIPKIKNMLEQKEVLPVSHDDREDDEVLQAPGFNIPERSSANLMNNPLFHGVPWNTSSRQSMPISKWPIRYSGTDNGVGLNLFLRQVEFFAASEGMTKGDLFQSAHQLLVGPASAWYVAKWPTLRHKDWDYFVMALRKQFLSSNIDHYIKVKSMSMYQGRNEFFSNFLVRMEQFFLCRTTPLSEEDKFEIIWHTMRPAYRDRLALVSVDTLSTLESLCERIDANNDSLMSRFNLAFENRRVNEIDLSLEPHCSNAFEGDVFNAAPYRQESYIYQQQNPDIKAKTSDNYGNRERQGDRVREETRYKSQVYSNSHKNSPAQQSTSNLPKINIQGSWKKMSKADILKKYEVPERNVCLNCRKTGHHFTNCFLKRQVFCYVCGLPDFHYEECPYCEEKNLKQRNSRR